MERYKLKNLSINKLEYGSGAAAKNFDGFTRYIRITDIDENGNLNGNIVSPNVIDEKYLLNDGDILFARTGATVGKTFRYRKSYGRCVYAGFLIRVVPNREIIRPDYLYFFTKSPQYKQFVQGSMKVVAQPNINAKQYGDLELNVPNLKKQDEIIANLLSISRIVDLRRKELLRLDDLIKARFVELFGDFDLSHPKSNWKPISEIGTVVGGATPKTSVEEYWNGEYRWISPAELRQDSGVIYDSVKKITRSGIDSCSLQELPIGTVILSSRAPIGKVAIAGNTFYCNQGFKNIVCKENIIPRYLYSLLLFNTDYLNSLGRGATFKEISKSIVEKILIPVPAKEIQIEFENFCSGVDKSKVAVQRALDETQTLFDSLMQKYFG